MMKRFAACGSALVVATGALVALTVVPSGAVDDDIKITAITRTQLESGTCALRVRFTDRTPESVDADDYYSLKVSPRVTYDGQSRSGEFLVYPCSAFKKRTTYSFVVREFDTDGSFTNQPEVVAKSPAFEFRRR